MAQKVTISLVDDLDGGAAEETVGFSLDGRNYEIDLSSANANKLRGALTDFVAAARRPETRHPKASTNGRSAGSIRAQREEMREIRDWGRRQGHTISDRGRVPIDVIEAYRKSHKAVSAAG